MKAKEMILADAIRSAIENEKTNIKLRRLLVLSTALNIALAIIVALIAF